MENYIIAIIVAIVLIVGFAALVRPILKAYLQFKWYANDTMECKSCGSLYKRRWKNNGGEKYENIGHCVCEKCTKAIKMLEK